MEQTERANIYFAKRAARRATADANLAAQLVTTSTKNQALVALSQTILGAIPDRDEGENDEYEKAFAAVMATTGINVQLFEVFMVDPVAAYVMNPGVGNYTILIPKPPNAQRVVRSNKESSVDPSTQSTTGVPCTGG